MEKSPYTDDDLSLWECLRKGDENAFSALFVRFYDDLYAYSVKLTQEESLSHDIIQELFLNLWQTHHKLKQIESLKPFLLKCTKNLVIDYRRKVKTIERRNESIEKEEMVFSQEDFKIGTEEKAEQTEKVLALLNALPDRVREAIYLRFFIGLNYTEIARVMDVNIQSTRNFVHRGIRQMKDIYFLFMAIVPYNFLSDNM